MLFRCTKHGEIPIPYGVSQSIFDHVKNSASLAGQIHCMYIICPDYENKAQLSYLDEDDFSLASDYVSTLFSEERKNMLISILGTVKGCEIADNYLFLIGKGNGRLNDCAFLRKVVLRTKPICPKCLQEKLGSIIQPA